MAKTRAPYTPEFRRQMVELVRAGRSPEELAQEFEPTALPLSDPNEEMNRQILAANQAVLRPISEVGVAFKIYYIIAWRSGEADDGGTRGAQPAQA